MKNILLFEPDKETETLFSGWLRDVGYAVLLADSLEKIPHPLIEKRFDILIVDIDFPGTADSLLKQCMTLKSDPHLSGLPIIVLTYKKDIRKIAGSIEAGIDNFILKPFETDSFLKRIKVVFKEIELKKQGKKVLDLNYVNYLIDLAGELGRDDFFILAPIIFNRLIVDKIKTILGNPILMIMIKRANEVIGEDYEFMRATKFSNQGLLLDGVDEISKDIPVKKLIFAFRDYVYAFLHLVRTLTSDILMERI